MAQKCKGAHVFGRITLIFSRVRKNRVNELFYKNQPIGISKIKISRLSATGKQANCYAYYLYA